MNDQQNNLLYQTDPKSIRRTRIFSKLATFIAPIAFASLPTHPANDHSESLGVFLVVLGIMLANDFFGIIGFLIYRDHLVIITTFSEPSYSWGRIKVNNSKFEMIVYGKFFLYSCKYLLWSKKDRDALVLIEKLSTAHRNIDK